MPGRWPVAGNWAIADRNGRDNTKAVARHALMQEVAPPLVELDDLSHHRSDQVP